MGDDCNSHSMQDALDAGATDEHLVPAPYIEDFAPSYFRRCLLHPIFDLRHV